MINYSIVMRIANPPKRLTGCKFSVIFISGIPGHSNSQLFSLYIAFFFRIFATNFVKMSYYIINS